MEVRPMLDENDNVPITSSAETGHTGSDPAAAAPTAAPAVDRTAILEQEKQALLDRFLRTAADFENHKKRTEAQLKGAAILGREQVLLEILPTVDNLQRALHHAKEGDPVAVGVRQTERQLLSALENFGVERFTSVGQRFDPELHDALD